MCEGEIRGTVVITPPQGSAVRLAVHAPRVSERVCVGCDPTVDGPSSCDGACRVEFAAWIDLASFSFPWPGGYALAAEDMVLSCAPATTRFAGVGVLVDANGMTHEVDLDDLPRLAARVTRPPVAAETATATAIRQRLPRLDRPLQGEVEGLVIPVGPHPPKQDLAPTRWGALRTANRGTTRRFLTDAHGPYWLESGPAAQAPDDGRPHIVALAIDGESDAGRRAAQGGGGVVIAWSQLDAAPPGTARAVSLDVAASLDDASARWSAYLASQDAALATALESAGRDTPGQPLGREESSSETWFAPTWIPQSQELVVRYTHRVTRSSRDKRGGSEPCLNRPGMCPTPPAVRTYHADVALEVVYDRTGALRAERRYPAQPVPER